jgi:hypothetical protein
LRRRKKSAEIDGVWESREAALLCNNEEVTNLLEVKFNLVRRDDVEDFLDIARFSKEFGADDRHGRVIRNGVVLWMAGAAIDNKASILVGNDYLTVASFASRLGIKFIRVSSKGRARSDGDAGPDMGAPKESEGRTRQIRRTEQVDPRTGAHVGSEDEEDPTEQDHT